MPSLNCLNRWHGGTPATARREDRAAAGGHKPLSKDLVRNRIKAAGKRTGVKVTPHMLRHTFATQLVNAGAKITTIQALLGHVRLNTTMTYARVHDKTVVNDFLRAMAQIEGEQDALLEPKPATENALALLEKLERDGLNAEQQQILTELRRCLTQPATTNQNQPPKQLLTNK